MLDLDAVRGVVDDINENVTTYWTGASNAISSSFGWISGQAGATAAQYEALGRTFAGLSSDYANGLMNLAEGHGTLAERAMLREVAADLSAGIEQMRQGGVDAYTKYGENIAAAAKEGARATAAEVGGALVDGVNLANAVATAIQDRKSVV